MTTPGTQTISLPDPADKMDFDGERFVSGVPGEIAHEHYLRYLFAMQFCVGKAVLDIGSGEGYGSSILGQVAAKVNGTDLLAEAVDFARQHYGTESVIFSQGDLRDIPHPDAAFDVVVSFETLEHVTEHERFVAEIKRVLRPGGLLVMSSPDRDVYLRGLQPNPFHRRELNRNEFSALLAQFFAHYRLGQQRSLTGAVLLPDSLLHADRFATFVMDASAVERWDSLGNATYLIAVASDGPVPDICWGVLADVNYLQQLHAQAAYLGDEQRVFKSEVARLTSDLEARQADIGRLTSDIEFLQAQLAEAKARLNEDLQKQRTMLLTDVLEIFS
jgi:2-polyprenyl-3-methyl-5-hydroxy-6-metoxy-1,4-benzoquinol methylase